MVDELLNGLQTKFGAVSEEIFAKSESLLFPFPPLFLSLLSVLLRFVVFTMIYGWVAFPRFLSEE